MGDFNEDGLPDTVVANLYEVEASVFLSDGVAGFEPEIRVPTGCYPRSVAVADFDSDDHLDFVMETARSSSAR